MTCPAAAGAHRQTDKPGPMHLVSRLWSRETRVGLILVLAIVVACAGGALSGAFKAAENAYRDHAFAIADKPASGQVHIVEMDASSIAAIQEWPWSRDHYARVVGQLDAAGVRTISFDVDFSSASTLGGDMQFADALAKADTPVVIPTFAQSTRYGEQRNLDVLPIEPLRQHVTLGSVSIVPDADGFIRRMPMGTVTDGSPRPSLAAHIARQGGMAGETFPIDYSIDTASIPRHSFIAIERGEFDVAELRGKDVIIGATAIEMGDRYPVPRYGVVPGVVVQAISAETLLAGRPVYGSWSLPLAVAAILSFLVMRARGHATTALCAIGVIALLLGAAHLAKTSLQIWFEIVPACVALAATWAVHSLRLVRASYRKRLRVDAVTGLPNAVALQEDAAHSEPAYVIAGMIDRFEALKAVLGQEGQAALLERVVERLKATGCDGAIYRTGERVLSWTTSCELFEIEEMLAGLRAIMRSPVEVGGRRVDVALHFGIARYDGARAIGHAAHAANTALRKGEGWRLHEDSQSERLEQQVSLMGELDAAIEEGHIEVLYQPKLDLRTNAVTCSEALVRWRHPERGVLSPDLFVPLAEATNRIEELTLHVMNRAMLDLRSWREQDLALGVAVNISARLLSSPSFVRRTEALVASLDVPTGGLTFEVTESAELDDAETAIETLNRFRNLGISISLDDYGTGQSTLGYLKSLPITELKIDRSFVQHAHIDRSDAMLVHSTVQLAHELGLKVVAEGIEDAACLEFLRTLDCDYAQGYLVGRPMTVDALAEQARNPRRKAA